MAGSSNTILWSRTLSLSKGEKFITFTSTSSVGGIIQNTIVL